ncbi:MAG: stage sporulation protein [Clostridiales bacterium]|nr:stage sporulation protein [Clostridiales bacterium]
MKINRLLASALICLLLVISSVQMPVKADDWYGEEEKYFTVYDQDDKELFMIAWEVSKDDEYLSGDNKKYRIVSVDQQNHSAKAEYIEDVTLPDVDVSMIEDVEAAMAQQDGDKRIAMYCTHSDESYIPSDGTSSKPEKGGIYDVAEAFKAGLEKRGIQVDLDETSHVPHDAGAYRRSRRTALRLMRETQPAATFDIHRDAVPQTQYVATIAGENASKIRIVIGRGNPNKDANEALAYKIKALADKVYPGMIKDIYYGKGDYNQDLSPRSLLLEFGTYDHTKERAQNSAEIFANVVSAAVFGGNVKSPSTGETAKTEPAQKSDEGTGSGIIWWIVGIAVVGGIFLFVSSGGKEMFSKIKNNWTSFLGRNKK